MREMVGSGDSMEALREENRRLREQIAELVRVSGEGETFSSGLSNGSLHFGAALQSSERDRAILLREMLEGFALKELIYDAEGNAVDSRFLEVNPAFERIIGLKSTEVVGKTALTLWPGLSDLWVNVYRHLASTDDPIKLEFSNPEVGKHLEVTAFRTSPNRFASMFTDGTARRHAEQALRESESRYRSLVETTSDWVWEVDTEGRYTFVSSKVTEFLGYEPEEVLGKTPFDFMPEDEAQRVGELFAEISSGRKPIVALENLNLHKDGHPVHLETSGVPFFGCDGSFQGYRGMDRDITIRKHAERALVHSRDLMRYVLEHIPSAIAVHDRDLRYLYVSQRYLAMFGIEDMDVVGKDHHEILPVLAEKYREVHQRALNGEVVRQEEDEYIYPDGTPSWAWWECRPWKEANGEIGGIVVCIQNITALKATEIALRDRDRRHQAMVQGAMDGFWRLDFEGRIVETNRAYCRMSGYTEQELLGMTIADLEAMESRSDVEAHINKVFSCGEDRFETLHRRKDGSIYPVEVSAQYKPEYGGLLLAFLRDVTERKQAEAALRESEQRWKYALEGAGDGVWDCNPETNHVHYSKQWKAILGYADDEIGSTFAEWDQRLHPEDRARVHTTLHDHLEGRTANYSSEHRLLCRDGTYKWIFDRGKVIERAADGRALRVIGCHSDISQRKQSEEDRERLRDQLIQAQKMESVGRLAGGVAHDFNNLLTVINGYSDLALTRMRPEDPLRSSMAAIRQAGEHAAVLTRQLLAFSRRQVFETRKLSLNTVVEEMRPMLERLVGEDVEVWVSLTAGDATVEVDPHQLDQVIMNLVVNARDAMPKGGRLGIATTVGEFSRRVPGKPHQVCRVKLTISDTGIGMDEETQSKIFEPFFTTKATGQGTGLGLSTVQGIIEQSGGFIEVASKPGRGAEFAIYLPGGSATEQAVTGETVSATHKLPDGSGETLLVVEDQPAVREFAVTVLRSQGYRVLVAPGAVEAMEICRREGSPISLILTDLVMPEMSGTELAKWLEKTRPGAKVLFMSGYAENVVANHVRENERIELIEKPFAPQALIEKVRSLLAEPLARARVLVVDRDAEVRRLLRRALEQAGYVVADFGSAESALQQTAPGSADILLFDMELSANNGIDKVADLRKHARPRTVLGMAPGGDGVGEARPDMDADTVIRKPVNVKELLAVMESWLASRG